MSFFKANRLNKSDENEDNTSSTGSSGFWNNKKKQIGKSPTKTNQQPWLLVKSNPTTVSKPNITTTNKLLFSSEESTITPTTPTNITNAINSNIKEQKTSSTFDFYKNQTKDSSSSHITTEQIDRSPTTTTQLTKTMAEQSESQKPVIPLINPIVKIKEEKDEEIVIITPSTTSNTNTPTKLSKPTPPPKTIIPKPQTSSNITTETITTATADIYKIQSVDDIDFSLTKPKPPPKKSKSEIEKNKKESEQEKEKELQLSATKSKKVSKTPTKKSKSKLISSSESDQSQSSQQDSNTTKTTTTTTTRSIKSSKESLKDSSNLDSAITRVLSQSIESNEQHYEEAKNIIKQLKTSNDSKVIMTSMSQLAQIVTDQCTDFTLILRSHSLFLPLCDCLMNLCLINNNNDVETPKESTTSTTTPPSNSKKHKSPSSITSTTTTTTVSSVKRSNTFDSVDSLKKNNNNNSGISNNNNIDLLSLFLSTTGSSSSSLSTSSSLSLKSEFDDIKKEDNNDGGGGDVNNENNDSDDNNNWKPSFLKKKHKTNSGLSTSPNSSINTTPPKSTNSNSNNIILNERERKAINLATCFILYVFSGQQSNIEHFSRDTIEFLYQQSIKIPDNYLLEFYTTPSRLPKSPKSPKSPSSNSSGTPTSATTLRKVIELENNIYSNFQILVSDRVRFSVSTPSLSLATLSNLASNHINHSMKLKLKEFGLLDGMVNLLSKYIDYLNPIIDLTLISPKLIGNIEYILKIIDQCLIGDIKSNRIKLLTIDTLSMFITYLRYLYISITSNNDRLAGLDIKLIGSEAIISILNILLNITHENFNASKIISKISKPFSSSTTTTTITSVTTKKKLKKEFDIGDSGGYGVNLEFSDYLESLSNQSTLTPRKKKYLESLEIKENFSFSVIIQLLKLEVPEKYDIGQLCVSLLVNLVEVNPENREIFHNMDGAIDSILQLYLWRTSDNRILTRITTKTQEKIASSYLIILIGFLIKDHTENRQLVLKKLPPSSNNHQFDDPIQLLLDFIEFQFNNSILSIDIYNLVCNLINDVFLKVDQNSNSNNNNNNNNNNCFSNEIKLKYQSFKKDYDKKFNIEINNDNDKK